jgi:hypothetical protein
MLFAENQSGHGKAKDAITLYPFCRLMILVNDEPESLLILPPVDDSLDDKIMMLKVCENEGLRESGYTGGEGGAERGD